MKQCRQCEAVIPDDAKLCPHCRVAGRGDVHLKILGDDSGFRCVAVGHEYRWNAPHLRGVAREPERRPVPVHMDIPAAASA